MNTREKRQAARARHVVRLFERAWAPSGKPMPPAARAAIEQMADQIRNKPTEAEKLRQENEWYDSMWRRRELDTLANRA